MNPLGASVKMGNGSVNETSKSVTVPLNQALKSQKEPFFTKLFVRNLFSWLNVRTAIPSNYLAVKQPDLPMKFG